MTVLGFLSVHYYSVIIFYIKPTRSHLEVDASRLNSFPHHSFSFNINQENSNNIFRYIEYFRLIKNWNRIKSIWIWILIKQDIKYYSNIEFWSEEANCKCAYIKMWTVNYPIYSKFQSITNQNHFFDEYSPWVRNYLFI